MRCAYSYTQFIPYTLFFKHCCFSNTYLQYKIRGHVMPIIAPITDLYTDRIFTYKYEFNSVRIRSLCVRISQKNFCRYLITINALWICGRERRILAILFFRTRVKSGHLLKLCLRNLFLLGSHFLYLPFLFAHKANLHQTTTPQLPTVYGPTMECGACLVHDV